MEEFKKFEIQKQDFIFGGKTVKTRHQISGTNEYQDDWYDTVYDRYLFPN